MICIGKTECTKRKRSIIAASNQFIGHAMPEVIFSGTRILRMLMFACHYDRRQQFAYVTMKNSTFARIFGYFEDVFVLCTGWNDPFCSSVNDVGIWWQIFNFVFLSPKRWFQFNCRIVRTHFSSIMTLNNWKIYCILLHFQMKFSLPSTSCLRTLLIIIWQNAYDRATRSRHLLEPLPLPRCLRTARILLSAEYDGIWNI